MPAPETTSNRSSRVWPRPWPRSVAQDSRMLNSLRSTPGSPRGIVFVFVVVVSSGPLAFVSAALPLLRRLLLLPEAMPVAAAAVVDAALEQCPLSLPPRQHPLQPQLQPELPQPPQQLPQSPPTPAGNVAVLGSTLCGCGNVAPVSGKMPVPRGLRRMLNSQPHVGTRSNSHVGSFCSNERK